MTIEQKRREPYAWFWSHGSDQGVLTLLQDYEQHKSDYPGMTFTAVYTTPQPTHVLGGLVEALEDIINDYVERFDMESPSTNPGMKHVVEAARKVLADHRTKEEN